MNIALSVDPAFRGPSMNASNGRKIYPFDPRPEEVDIEVIAHHLATNNRWNGATQHKTFRSRITFSVAEHSVLVAKYLREVLDRPDLELEGLLHDAPEHLFGDMIRPFKHYPAVHAIVKPLEDKAEKAIAERFNLLFPLPKEIKLADNAVCTAEFRQIVPHPADDPSHMLLDETPCAPYEIEMMDAFRAKEYFLQAYEDAMSRRHKFR